MTRLIEIEPGRFRMARNTTPPARSDLPLPYVISDSMEPTEQVNGEFYSSKSAFRRVGKQLGLIEIGTEKLKPKQRRASGNEQNKKARQEAIGKAVSQYKAGRRVQVGASKDR